MHRQGRLILREIATIAAQDVLVSLVLWLAINPAIKYLASISTDPS